MVREIIGGAVLLVAVIAAGSWFTARANEWEQRAVRAETRAEMLVAERDSALAVADSLALANDSLAGIEAERDTVIQIIREEIAALPPEPEGCRAFIEPRDRLISECELQVATVRERLQARSAEVDALRRAEIAASERGDSLAAVLADRPTPRPGWLPEVKIGPFAGVCADGQACFGAGVSLGWKVF